MAGIASKNLFDLLSDDNDSDQPSAQAKSSKSGPVKADTKATQQRREETRPKPGQSTRDLRGGQSGFRERTYDRPPRSGGDEPYEYRGRGRGGGGGGRGRGRGRGREDRRGPPPNDDRHSKSGVVDHEKQVAHGWGGNTGTAEFEDEKAGEAIAKAEGEGAEKPEGDANGDAEEGEEELKTKSLDDYLAEKAEKRLQVGGSREARKPNEGLSKKFPQGKEFSRDEDENFITGSTGKKTRERAKKEKAVVELDGDAMRPTDTGSERRGRGRGRGGDFGGRGRGRGGDRGRGDGHRGEGHRGEGHRGEGHRGEGHRGEGHRGEGHRGEGHRGEGHRGEGHRGEGHRGDGYRGDRGGPRGRGGRGGSGAAFNVSDTSAFPTLGA